jgi:outer membrane receptor protein involved in Fe transport
VTRGLLTAAISLTLAAALCSPKKAGAEFDYRGLPLAEALESLRSQGLRLVYSDNTVKPEMVVENQIEDESLRSVLDQLLQPHGLEARAAPGGILSVVKALHAIVSGEVRDAAGEAPLHLATVEILGLSSTLSDATGNFEFSGVPPGDLEIETRKAGYVIDRQEITASSGNRTRVTIHLHPVAETLEEMVVTPGQISVLQQEPAAEVLWTRDDVNRLPHLSDDLFRAVARLPGNANGDFSADFHIRGGERNEMLVLIDGLRVYEPYHLKDFQNVFSIFDSNATGSVKMASGGFTSEYSDRMSGVVEIASVVPLERQNMFGVSFEKLHFLGQGRFANGDAGWLVNARRGYLDLLLDTVQSEEDDFNLSPVYYDLFGKLRRRIGSNSLLSVSVLAAADETEFRSDDDDDDFKSSYGNAYVWAKLDSAFNPRISQTSVLSFGHLDSKRDGESGANLSDPFFRSQEGQDHSQVSDRRTANIVHFRQDWQLNRSDRHYLKSGFEVRWLQADYDTVFLNRVTDPVFTDQEVLTERHLDLQPDGWTYGAYIADRFRLGQRLTVEAGLRWDRQTYKDDEQWSPRLNFVADLSSKTTLRTSWGHYWQSQGIHELQIADGVQEYHPAQLNRQTTVSLDHKFGEKQRASIQLYAKQLRDPRPRYENLFEPIDIIPEGQSDRVLVAPERGRARGVELLFERRQRRLDWWITYALSKAEDKIDGSYAPRSWDQRHAVSYSFNLQLKEPWNLNLAGLHHSGWPTTSTFLEAAPDGALPQLVLADRNGSQYPDYHRIDFRVSRVFKKANGELKLFLEVSNLLDRDNIRSISDFEIIFDPTIGFSVDREFEKWFPRLPSFGVTWTF